MMLYWLLLCSTHMCYSFADEPTHNKELANKHLTTSSIDTSTDKNSQELKHSTEYETSATTRQSVDDDSATTIFQVTTISNSSTIHHRQENINVKEYQHWLDRNRACRHEEVENITLVAKTIEDKSSNITKYKVSLNATILNEHGNAFLVINTTEADFPIDVENPNITFSQDDEPLTIGVELVPCSTQQGPLIYSISIKCETQNLQKCNETAHKDIKESRNYTINVIGNTTYNITLMLYRQNQSNKDKIYLYNVTTNSTAPHAPVDLAIYSKSKGCAYLRWRNRNTSYNIGEVKQYIEYSNGSSTIQCNKSAIRNCNKWNGLENYFCGSCCPLTSNMSYTFMVRANNSGVDVVSEPKSTILIAEQPEPPRHLAVSWSGFNLTLMWEHPLFPNGIICAFRIFINGEQIAVYNKTTYTIPDKNYRFWIGDAREYKSPTLNISVCTINDAGRSAHSSITTTRITTAINNSIISINVSDVTNLEGDSYIYVFDKNDTDSTHENSTLRCNDIRMHYTAFFTMKLNQSQINSSIRVNYTCHEAHKPIILLINELENITTCSSTIVNCKPGNIFRGSNNTKPDDVPDNSEFTTSLAVLISFLLVGSIVAAIIRYYVKMKSKIRIESPKEEIVAAHFPITAPPPFSQIVSREDFKNYITQEEVLQKQFQTVNALPIIQQTVGKKEENKFKNRYQNIIPFDDMRVILNRINGDEHSDYINASYIHGYSAERRYIATQGPLTTTLNDFWTMIWQENVECIVMLANFTEDGKKKCEIYWPSLNDAKSFGGVEVLTLQDVTTKQYIKKRVFQVQSDGQSRTVTHIHFTEWPDHGVPDSPLQLAELITEVRECKNGSAPILVHCSAGIGRTGTFILCDIALDMVKETGKIDVYKIFYELRQQRCFMVQMRDQYLYAHDVILELLEKHK